MSGVPAFQSEQVCINSTSLSSFPCPRKVQVNFQPSCHHLSREERKVPWLCIPAAQQPEPFVFLTSVSDSWARLPVGNKHLFESLGHSRENQSAGSEAESGIQGLTGRGTRPTTGCAKRTRARRRCGQVHETWLFILRVSLPSHLH